MNSARTTERLQWGHGPRKLDVFLEPTCPYSVLAFEKLDAVLEAVGEDVMTLELWLHSQPWHLFSSVIIRCAVAASTLPGGKEAAKRVLASVAAHRTEFEPADHWSGPLLTATPAEIVARVEKYAELNLSDALSLPVVAKEIKRHTKYARQNGIHFTPTFMIDGLVEQSMNSGDNVSDWIARLLT